MTPSSPPSSSRSAFPGCFGVRQCLSLSLCFLVYVVGRICQLLPAACAVKLRCKPNRMPLCGCTAIGCARILRRDALSSARTGCVFSTVSHHCSKFQSQWCNPKCNHGCLLFTWNCHGSAWCYIASCILYTRPWSILPVLLRAISFAADWGLDNKGGGWSG